VTDCALRTAHCGRTRGSQFVRNSRGRSSAVRSAKSAVD